MNDSSSGWVAKVALGVIVVSLFVVGVKLMLGR